MNNYKLNTSVDVLIRNKVTNKIEFFDSFKTSSIEPASTKYKFHKDYEFYDALLLYVGKTLTVEEKCLNGEIRENDCIVSLDEDVIILTKINQ